MSKRYYTWKPDVPDHRDRYAAVKPDRPLPRFVDRIGMGNPIEDQGQLGSCTGNASTSAVEIVTAGTQLSRLMAYYNGREAEGDVNEDGGAMIRSVIKSFFRTGVATERSWPYVPQRYAEKPAAKAYDEATALRALLTAGFEYARVSTLMGLKQSLADGHPVVFGFAVPEKFDALSSPWVLELPTLEEQLLGGHAVMAAGYDDRPSKPFVWVRNSWGRRWGMLGYYKMTQDWFTDPRRLVDDMWVIRRVTGAKAAAEAPAAPVAAAEAPTGPVQAIVKWGTP